MKNIIDTLINEQINSGNIAGATIYFYKDGKLILDGRYGFANIAEQKPMCDNTIFRIYSMTKPITAAAIMLLVERGVINLSDLVQKYLSGFKNQTYFQGGEKCTVKNKMTISHLLNMTSGIPYPDADAAGIHIGEVFDEAIEKIQTDSAIETLELAQKIGGCPLSFEPGSAYRYGASIDILGAIIEVVSGKKLSEFLQENIFYPLEMTDTAFYVPFEKLERFCENYVYNDEQKRLVIFKDATAAIFNFKEPPAFESGGGGLCSTASDYYNFATMLLNDGAFKGKQILSGETVAFMRSNQLNAEQLKFYETDRLKGYGYGNAMRVLLDPQKAGSLASIGEFGWDGLTGNHFAIDPVKKTIFLYFIQRVAYTNNNLFIAKVYRHLNEMI